MRVFTYGTATPALATGKLDRNPDQSDKLVFRGVTLRVDGVPSVAKLSWSAPNLSMLRRSNPAQSLTVAVTDPAAAYRSVFRPQAS